VAILDADKEGFLRSTRSLIQTFGRAARNIRGKVIMYAEKVTRSMQAAIGETNRRRDIQGAYNIKYDIIPQTVKKEIRPIFTFDDELVSETADTIAEKVSEFKSLDDIDKTVKVLEQEMKKAAKALEFERAAELRDHIRDLKTLVVLEE
jgi:excinuclease ABC subunit B